MGIVAPMAPATPTMLKINPALRELVLVLVGEGQERDDLQISHVGVDPEPAHSPVEIRSFVRVELDD